MYLFDSILPVSAENEPAPLLHKTGPGVPDRRRSGGPTPLTMTSELCPPSPSKSVPGGRRLPLWFQGVPGKQEINSR